MQLGQSLGLFVLGAGLVCAKIGCLSVVERPALFTAKAEKMQVSSAALIACNGGAQMHIKGLAFSRCCSAPQCNEKAGLAPKQQDSVDSLLLFTSPEDRGIR